jgi:diguanylate cyclase (GGDEF)-like protein
MVLGSIAKITNKKLRRSDICGRWGGEKFLLFCTETELEGATALAEKMRRVIKYHVFPRCRKNNLLFWSSYKAKHNGKNIVF